MLKKSTSVSGLFNIALVWAVFLPFIPVLIPSSDTQPTFLLVFSLAFITSFAFPAAGRKLFHFTLSGTIVALFVASVLYALLLIANLSERDASIPSRLVSFAQFLAAAFWGYSGKFQWSEKLLFRALVGYAIFTVIYFATHGAIENVLIHSRAENSAMLFALGRGARTLSPEPSFFALQVFNIFVLARILFAHRPDTTVNSLKWVAVTGFCLAASFSAYGALLLILVVLATHPRMFVILSVACIAAWQLLASYLERFDSVRAIKLLLTVVSARVKFTDLASLDASVASRLLSFGDYLRSFGAHPLIGNGFSLYQGGGFVSIVAAFGLAGVGFFAWLLVRILRGVFDTRTKIVLVAWFVLNFVSGPIGVPIIGLIVGKLFARRLTAADRAPQPAALPSLVVVR